MRKPRDERDIEYEIVDALADILADHDIIIDEADARRLYVKDLRTSKRYKIYVSVDVEEEHIYSKTIRISDPANLIQPREVSE